MELDDLDKVNKAKRIINGVRDNIRSLENSRTKLIPHTIYVVLEVALDKAFSLLDEVVSDDRCEMT